MDTIKRIPINNLLRYGSRAHIVMQFHKARVIVLDNLGKQDYGWGAWVPASEKSRGMLRLGLLRGIRSTQL